DELSFTWSASRGSAHVKTQLQGFVGTLLTDGYAAYDAFAKHTPDVTQAQCWAHTRRHFERALDDDPAAHQALELIGALYRVEQQIRDRKLEGAAKLEHRSRHALPVVDAFFGWCYAQRQRLDLVTRAPFAKALVYADSRQAELRVYLGDPAVPIDTNHLERALRVIPMGRKNWLFCWTEVGARHVGPVRCPATSIRSARVGAIAARTDRFRHAGHLAGRGVAIGRAALLERRELAAGLGEHCPLHLLVGGRVGARGA
ncbi:MAG: IS66 family transposase, partial [Candidatus Nanopelagicales bacterium]|nr:IS66 family transposase [Candidatus Nanopelagicales bacterium]